MCMYASGIKLLMADWSTEVVEEFVCDDHKKTQLILDAWNREMWRSAKTNKLSNTWAFFWNCFFASQEWYFINSVVDNNW